MPFQVIFEGLNDNSPEEKARIKEKLIEKFKVPAEKAERMVNSTPIVVKKGLTQDQATKYKIALESIGAQASIRIVVDDNETSAKQQDSTAATPLAEKEASSQPLSKPESKPEVATPVSVPTVISSPINPIGDGPTVLSTAPVVGDPEFIFYNSLDDLPEAKEPKIAPESTPIDPYKTQIASPAQPTIGDEIEQPTVAQEAISLAELNQNGEWWQTILVLNPAFDEAARSVTPITGGRITAKGEGISIAHPTVNEISFASIQLISAFQIGFNNTARLNLDIFSSVSPRPIRLDADLIITNSFGLSASEDTVDRLLNFIKILINRNRYLLVDLATYKFLKDKTQVKKAWAERDIEKYCGKLQSEIDKGLDPKANPDIITCQQAAELFDSPDPWAVVPPSAPLGGLPMSGMSQPPMSYDTQPMRPPGTAPAPANFTHSQPPVYQPPPQYPPQTPQQYPPKPPQQYPPQQYPPPGGYQPNPPQGAPYPPGQGYPNPAPFNQPGNQPFNRPVGYAPPPQISPGQQPFGVPLPQPGQSPLAYPAYNQPMPGQMPMPAGMRPGYNDPNIELELKKAKEGAQTALIFSFIGLVCTCLFPFSIIGLIKAQDVLQILDKYRVMQDRNKALVAKFVSIAGLILQALVLLRFFLGH